MSGCVGACQKCGEQTYLLPLHDERGGPLFCFMCAGAWHAEHGPLRRTRRLVIKALRAYTAAGGHLYGKDFDDLKLAADGLAEFVGLKADNTEFSDLTSELLAAAIALTHPDKHPPERRAEANRVTQELHALKPFVFPEPKPEPIKPRDVSSNKRGVDLNKPSQPAYPCEDCRDTIDTFYCDTCKAEWERRRQKEREIEEKKRQQKNDRQRARYKRKRQIRAYDLSKKPIECATCGKALKSKRSDAVYCSAICRQRAYLKRDGKPSNSKPLGAEHIESIVTAVFTADPDNAFTTDDLCDRVYPGLKRVERKHRAAIIPIAKKVCERLGENWDYWRGEVRGGTLVFWNRASVTSYAMARQKCDWLYRYRYKFRPATEADLKAEIAPGGRHHEHIVEGGAWWQHCQEDIAKFKQTTANQNAARDNLTSRHAEAAE
jgi:hypothetical protein